MHPPAHQLPIVPCVLMVGTRTRPYQIEPIQRASVLYATPSTIRLRSSQGQHSTKQEHACLPTVQAWEKVQILHGELARALEVLATELLALGTYATRLARAGGIKKHPQPLSETVIEAAEPGRCWSAGWYHGPWYVPQVSRLPVERHTPRMLQLCGRQTTQDSHFVCPTNADWARVLAAYTGATHCSAALRAYLEQLGTYAQAISDGRYESPSEPQLNPAPQQQLSLLG